MKSYLKHYKIKLTTLAPVFVGSGREINKRAYIFDGSVVYVADEKKLMDVIISKNLVNSYFDSMQLPYFNLKIWLDKNGISDYKSLSAYTLLGVENIDDKHSLKEIRECIKNAYNEPYIPGSSLKGLLRTIILWNKVHDNYNKLASVRKELSDGLNARKVKSALNSPAVKMEKSFFNTKIDNVDASIMRGLIVSDSKPLSLDDIVLCEKIDINLKGKEKRPNILRECIRPKTEIEFDLTIDSSVFKYDIDTLNKMTEQYSKAYDDIVTSVFPQITDRGNGIFIGGGVGYFSKTVTYSLFNKKDDAVNFVRSYLSKTTPWNHKHKDDRKLSPHMIKCTCCDGKIYEMGKCRIEIEEI